MIQLDSKNSFLPVNIAVLTVSDTRTLSEDKSGSILVERLTKAGHNLAAREILKDDKKLIAKKFREWANDKNIEFILSTGGTGLTGRDVTPEALAMISEKEIPGFGELFRMLSYAKIKTSTIQSRACAGVLNGTYIFSLPGSPGACKDAWDDILVYQLDIRHKPCNFVELLPRLKDS